MHSRTYVYRIWKFSHFEQNLIAFFVNTFSFAILKEIESSNCWKCLKQNVFEYAVSLEMHKI